MNTDERAMAVLERANPVPTSDVVDVPMRADRYLDDIQQRSSTVTIESTDSQSTPRRWWMLGAAAGVVALAIVGVALVGGSDDPDNVVVDTPETLPATTVAATSPPVDPVETAREDFASFVDVYNAGDTDGTLGLLSDDAIGTVAYGGSPIPESYDPNDPWPFELNFAWNQAQGEAWSAATCGPADEQLASGTTLVCEWETLDGVIRAVDGDPVPTRALVVMSDGAVAELHVSYGFPDFTSLGSPFSSWMATHHPDVEGTECCAGDTREESEQRGRLRGQWAQAWATWLDEWGCETTNCTIPIDDWVAQYDLQCLAIAPTDQISTLVDEMRRVPPADSAVAPRSRLLQAELILVNPAVTPEQTEQYTQQRLEAMIELGIDERCHPVIE